MNYKIEFHIPKSETIPTRLRLKVNEKDVYYKRSHDKFAYEIEVYQLKGSDEGLEIVKHLASILCNQSYDHGAEWRVTDIEQIKPLEWESAAWEVTFHIKDSY